ncbi:MAG: Peptidoglycan-binding LysM [Candidatus Woesebacteria bacterium GW2011_GWA1_37_7]|uniref:Peptidoglycan-binding LysM n=1 Tax=Candidatus Woesebacteria bacterium GW2011_GWA1_37_7 TaxID=1618545 RepID=A0A0G0GXR2_9BACT|nr:MAG: Peptidoglycan-binding LysM [Candidatus Woesebacteria bacterium GW2011_GWA1_37_7]
MNLKNLLKSLKLNESFISMLLGGLLIIVVGILFVNFMSNRKGEVVPPIDTSETLSLPTTYIAQSGENLWKISEKYYGTGYNWTDIAKENSISNPNEIREGQTLTIPDVEPKLIGTKVAATVTPVVAVTGEIETVTLAPTETGAIAPESEVSIGKTHKVVKGEDLWNISINYYQSGYNWVDIAKANNLTNPGIISEGQELIIPAVEPIMPLSLSNTSSAEAISGDTYTVSEGDTLWSIAVRAYADGYRWVDIAKDNSLVTPQVIHPGNTLKLSR